MIKLTAFDKLYRGLYTEKTNLGSTVESEKVTTGCSFSVFFVLWYTLNGITRMLSFVGLFHVFYEVFVAFRPSKTFHIAFLPSLPYVILLVVGMKFHVSILISTLVFFVIIRILIKSYKFQVTYLFSITT